MSRVLLLLLVSLTANQMFASSGDLFRDGTNAFLAGDYARATKAFGEAAARRPAAGTLQNLGITEWRLGNVGPAVLAWERALWLDPFNRQVHNNLRFARRNAQLESPELSWYEVVSTWLPVNWWGMIAGFSFWLAVAMGLLPGIFRWRKAVWHQAVAALGLAFFLLSLPAHLGVKTRSRIGFVLQNATPLRLTPTEDAQFVTHLAAGEPARLERTRGGFVLIRTSRTVGWIEKGQLGIIARQLES